MAFVNRPAASYEVIWRDASGTFGRTKFNFPFATNTTIVLAAAEVLRANLGALSDAAIVGESLTYSYFDDNPAAAAAGSRIEEKGQFIFRTANARTTGMTIPAIKDSVLNVSGSINRSALAVTTFVAGLVAVDAIFCSADGSDIRSLEKAYQRFNGSTRNQLPNDR